MGALGRGAALFLDLMQRSFTEKQGKRIIRAHRKSVMYKVVLFLQELDFAIVTKKKVISLPMVAGGGAMAFNAGGTVENKQVENGPRSLAIGW